MFFKKIIFFIMIWPSFSLLLAKSATVNYIAGEVSVKTAQGSSFAPAKLNQSLNINDMLRTGKNSFALLTFPDGSKVKLRAESEIVMSNLGGGLDGIKNDIQLKLNKGGAFSQVTKRSPSDVFQIKTPTHVAGVRGTQFFVAIDKIAGEDDSVMMCVNEGSIEVSDILEHNTVKVNAGEGLVLNTAQPSSSLPAPQKLKWIRSFNWNMNPEQGKIEDDTSLQKAYKKSYKNAKDYDYD